MQEGEGAGATNHLAGGRVQAGPSGRVPWHPLRPASHRTLEVNFKFLKLHSKRTYRMRFLHFDLIFSKD